MEAWRCGALGVDGGTGAQKGELQKTGKGILCGLFIREAIV